MLHDSPVARASAGPTTPRSVLVDARALHASGIGRYLREILSALLRDPRSGCVTLLGEPESLIAFARQHASANIRIISYPPEFYSPRVQLAWLGLLMRARARADVAFFPHYDAPAFALPKRSVVTVHDLTHFKVPGGFPAWQRLPAEILLRRSVAAAARVVTVSQAARQDIIERFPWATDKIDVVPNGVSPFFRERGGSDSAGQQVHRGAPYLLCVGNRKPHKNLIAAVETLALVRRARPEMILILVGQAYDRYSEIRRKIQVLGLNNAVVELAVVDDEILRGLYGGCEVLLFPSLYEGFGLPILEAMACGAPVVASNRASIPEVAGDAALLVDPHDYAGMAAAVHRLTADSGFRHEMVRRGHERAAAFPWNSAAARTVDILHETAAQVSR